ncbi:MAG: protein kinase domain-containing protein [Acidobacteriota bacterium]
MIASPDLTRTSALLGTPLYMAPELARGGRAAGTAADVFSFGVVAYELLAAKLPHAAPPVLERLAGRALAPPPRWPMRGPSCLASCASSSIAASPRPPRRAPPRRPWWRRLLAGLRSRSRSSPTTTGRRRAPAAG